jgi:hypothetical protein
MIVTLYPNIENSYWQLSTTVDGGIVEELEDLKQQVLNCLTTNKGSVPFDPTAGFNIYELLDEPVNWVIPNGKLGILDALENGVPLITVTTISHIFLPSDPAHVTFIVFCESNIGNFEVAVSNNPNFTPISSQGAFSSGFSSGFFV